EREQYRAQRRHDPRAVALVVLGHPSGDRRKQERPDEGEQTDHVREDEERDPHPRDEDRAPFASLGFAHVRHPCPQPERRPSGHLRASATCSGVSHPGPNTRVICGAKTRESPRTDPGSPSAMTSPPASITTRVATAAASSTSCVAITTVLPRAA